YHGRRRVSDRDGRCIFVGAGIYRIDVIYVTILAGGVSEQRAEKQNVKLIHVPCHLKVYVFLSLLFAIVVKYLAVPVGRGKTDRWKRYRYGRRTKVRRSYRDEPGHKSEYPIRYQILPFFRPAHRLRSHCSACLYLRGYVPY